jgi:hypothetical protein
LLPILISSVDLVWLNQEDSNICNTAAASCPTVEFYILEAIVAVT